MTELRKLEQTLKSLFPSEEISLSEQDLPTRLTVFPRAQEQVVELVRLAKHDKITIFPLGGGTHLYPYPNKSVDVAVSLTQMPEQIEHSPSDLVVTVSAGAPFSRTQEKLCGKGQMIPSDACYRLASTIGGVVSANAWGPRRHRYGTARDWVLATTLVNGEGKTVKAGAKVVKNVSGYDLNKLYVGSRGTLGIILDLTLKLQPAPGKRCTHVATYEAVNNALAAADAVHHTPLDVEAMVLVSGKWNPENNRKWSLIITLAGTKKGLYAQQDRLATLISDKNEAGDIIPEEEADAVWRIVNRPLFRQGQDGQLLAKISVSKKNLKLFLRESLPAVDSQISLKAFPGAGVCYLGMRGKANECRTVARNVVKAVRHLGGGMEIEAAPRDCRLDRWPILPPSLSWMKQIKKALDPDGIFAPGTYIGGI